MAPLEYNDLIPELIVSDIDKSKDFYVRLLGFSVTYERPEDNFIFLSLGKIQLMLEEGEKEDLELLHYPFGRGVNFTFGVDNITDIYQRLIENNYPIKKELTTLQFRVDDKMVTPREFSVLDPDGYFIRISD
ncbi:bleomycin resistance protein [Streptococcus zalophi]|uniref:Bleomycin resistance protein n=1 Tax=Streptococcus zalophi TaxID=640031 RepID=A0A934PBP9_9STRE|nr:VOC family protein [Streptococcus zalophi]MBJ8350285.1 VOC family protein [Streptococcus zalophi]